MKEFHLISDLADSGIRSVAVAAGIFDGVHRGHLQVVRAMLRLAEQTGACPCVLTFSPHPKSVLAGQTAPETLLPKKEKYRLLYEAGVKVIVEHAFTKEFAALSPEAFLQECLHAGTVSMKVLVVGSRWRFGAGGRGNCELIRDFAEKEHFCFEPVPELQINGEIVSSSRIRKAIAEGNLEAVREMLGRNHVVFGTVIPGLGLAGKVLGYPTANLDLTGYVIPAFGVYAGYCTIDGVLHKAVANVGVAPTIRKETAPKPKFEIHIPDFSGNLYGKSIQMELVSRIRPEQKFDSVEALKRQMGNDLSEAMKRLA